MAPPSDPKAQDHFRSWKATDSFSAIHFDRDKLQRWKYISCVQTDGTDRQIEDRRIEIFNITFLISSRHWYWPWPRSYFPHTLFRTPYISFDVSWREEHDAGKINVVPLLSQELSPDNIFLTAIFRVFVPWRLTLLVAGGIVFIHPSGFRGHLRNDWNYEAEISWLFLKLNWAYFLKISSR